MQLSNISAVVTGGASGLGLACARPLVARGVQVVIADLNPERGAAAHMALHILENAMLNGETIRLDGAIRMAPR